MRSANNPILVGLVLLFLLGHFFLLVGILMRIGATTLGPGDQSLVQPHGKDQEAAYEANRMQLL